MGPFRIVKIDPFADDARGDEAVGRLLQVDRLVFQRAPQAFDEDVIQAPAAPVHGDGNASVVESAGEGCAGKLGEFKRSSQQSCCWLMEATGQAPLPAFSNQAFFGAGS